MSNCFWINNSSDCAYSLRQLKSANVTDYFSSTGESRESI